MTITSNNTNNIPTRIERKILNITGAVSIAGVFSLSTFFFLLVPAPPELLAGVPPPAGLALVVVVVLLP